MATQTAAPNAQSTEALQELAQRLSRDIIEMTTEAGSGHPSSSLSAIDIMTALYFGGIMNYRVDEPHWAGRDRFILSKGHAAPALYAVLAEAGYISKESLDTLRDTGSPIEGHPNMLRVPGVEASTGSLGQGLSMGLGHALAARVDGDEYRVYVIIGDGEADQGQVWEAAMAAAKYNVDNLVCIIDYNKYQQTASVEKVMPSLAPLAAKWEAFDWHVEEIDGHNMQQVMETLQSIQSVKGKPQVIVANTLKGRGLSPFENDPVSRKHGSALSEDDMQTALAELSNGKATVSGL